MGIFNERLKELKEENNYTLKDLSEKVGISVSNLSYYMNSREPNYETLCRISNFFEVTADYLIGRTNQRNPREESFINSIQNEAGQKIEDNKLRNEIENNCVKFYNIMSKITMKMDAEDDFSDLWDSIKVWLEAMYSYTKYIEVIQTDPYPLDIVKETMDKLSKSRKIAQSRIFQMLAEILDNADVPPKIKKRIIVQSIFGIRSESKEEDICEETE